MQLDISTLLVVLFLSAGILALSVLLVAWRDRTHDGLGLWGLGLLFNSISYPVFGLRMMGWLTASIILYNLMNAATIACHTHAVRAFQNGGERQIPLIAIWGLAALGVLLSIVLSGHHQIRNVSIAAVSFLQMAMLAYSVATPAGLIWRHRGRLLITLGASTMMLMFLIRAVTLGLHADWSDSLGVPADVQATSYLVVLTTVLLNTIGFVLMQKERAVEIQHEQAVRDPLTGVFNRRALMEELTRWMSNATRQERPLSVLMIDLDHFKDVNDTHGHQAGDAVLQAVAGRIQGRLRRGDLLARFGGEEFVVVLPATGADGAGVIAEHIRHRVAADPVMVDGTVIPITVSVGWHAWQGDPESGADRLLGTCDSALYEAKRRGRNCVVGSSSAPVVGQQVPA